jgi:hypothetical protein
VYASGPADGGDARAYLAAEFHAVAAGYVARAVYYGLGFRGQVGEVGRRADDYRGGPRHLGVEFVNPVVGGAAALVPAAPAAGQTSANGFAARLIEFGSVAGFPTDRQHGVQHSGGIPVSTRASVNRENFAFYLHFSLLFVFLFFGRVSASVSGLFSIKYEFVSSASKKKFNYCEKNISNIILKIFNINILI